MNLFLQPLNHIAEDPAAITLIATALLVGFLLECLVSRGRTGQNHPAPRTPETPRAETRQPPSRPVTGPAPLETDVFRSPNEAPADREPEHLTPVLSTDAVKAAPLKPKQYHPLEPLKSAVNTPRNNLG